jgi:predicted HNH restriction endonuclease
MGQSEKQKEWKKQHYEENKELYINKQQERRQNIRILVESFKTPCIVCGESDKACIDYHHVNPSEKDLQIGNAGKHKWSDKKIISEIEKCVCLCSNHHRILHHYDFSVEELIKKYKS